MPYVRKSHGADFCSWGWLCLQRKFWVNLGGIWVNLGRIWVEFGWNLGGMLTADFDSSCAFRRISERFVSRTVVVNVGGFERYTARARNESSTRIHRERTASPPREHAPPPTAPPHHNKRELPDHLYRWTTTIYLECRTTLCRTPSPRPSKRWR